MRAMAMWAVLGVLVLYLGVLVVSTAKNPGQAKRTSLEDLLVPSATTTTAVPVPKQAAGPQPAAVTTTIRPIGELEILVNGLNLRSGPNRRSPVLAVLRRGEKVSILGQSSSWYQVFVPASKKVGYVSSRSEFVRRTDPQGGGDSAAQAESRNTPDDSGRADGKPDG